MESILQEHNYAMPARDVLAALAEKFRYAILPILFLIILSSISSMLLKSRIEFMYLVSFFFFVFLVVNHQTVKAKLQCR